MHRTRSSVKGVGTHPAANIIGRTFFVPIAWHAALEMMPPCARSGKGIHVDRPFNPAHLEPYLTSHQRAFPSACEWYTGLAMSNPLFDLGLSKLFEMLQSVVSIWIIRPTAKARAAERLMAAEAKAKAKLLAARTDIDVEKTKIEGNYELLEFERRVQAKYLPVKVEVDIDIPVIWEVEPQFITADGYRSPFQPVEQKRLNNIQQVTVDAIKALPEQGEVSEQHVDPDWTARFFENVKDVSNEDMQKLWGKLLAGEIASPGKFSLRTLDVLKNMTSVEAKIFEQAVRYCNINGQLLRVVIDIPSACKLSQKELMRLVECGLFHSPLDLDQTESDNKSKALLKAMRLAPNPFDITEGALVYTLTGVGAELATLKLNRATDAEAGGDVCDEKKP